MSYAGALKRKAGFSLVEVLVGIAIFVVILAVMYAIYFSGQDLWEIERNKLDMQAHARTALGLMSRELQRATDKPTQTSPPNLSIPAAPNNTRVTFYLPRDIDANGVPDIANDQIIWDTANPIEYRYFSAEKELRRIEAGEEKVLARDVSAVSFTDYAIDNSLPPEEVRIHLTLTRTTTRQRNVPFSLRSVVRARN